MAELQISLFTNDKDYSLFRNKVNTLMSRMDAIREELNEYLFFNPDDRPTINSPADIHKVVSPLMVHLDHEELWVLVLDSRNSVMKIVQLYKGTVNQSNVRVAEVFRQAVIDNAPSIIVAHNHPSGDPTPSADDIRITKIFAEAGKLLDIEFLDHVIVGKTDFISFKQRALF